MLGNSNKKSLTHEQLFDLINKIKSHTTILGLLNEVRESLGVRYSLYQNFPAVGALDFKNNGILHTFSIPEEIVNFIHKTMQQYGDPVAVAAFIKADFFWLSESVNEPHIIKTKHEKFVRHTIDRLGDGLCYPLFGPYNRKGYAFMGFGRDKSEFDPIMPYQVQSLIQISHIRYCLMIKALQRQIKLTPRESEILELISYGKTNPDIAMILGISPRTVAVHASKVFTKLGTTDRVSAAMRSQTIDIMI